LRSVSACKWLNQYLSVSQARISLSTAYCYLYSDLPTTGKLDVLSLSNELTEVVDWHQLGIQLGIPVSELSNIEADYHKNERRKTETLSLWLRRTPNASWEHVVKALRQMGEKRVAENIAESKIYRGINQIVAAAL